jgi:hypothetical protein
VAKDVCFSNISNLKFKDKIEIAKDRATDAFEEFFDKKIKDIIDIA